MKKHSIWRKTRPFRMIYNKNRNVLDKTIDSGHDDKTTGQLPLARSGSQKLNFVRHRYVRYALRCACRVNIKRVHC